ncbi:hypothetical protein OVY01_19945 [Robbsia sp. Bb-Pol-6]|uniref:Uncharacterized protein n=1 Tax=Robbsia betulipollinis TaxID=2981849 RepID=A0ABT3ZSK1_9BURK|nr:hypothetical protein [Robbsia betulipollinis]MCY0389422.1 hypothetical protein [Robbsia betulipollinis]
MNISKAPQQKKHEESRVFIRLHMSEAVARGASHIRSKRPASLQDGIDEVRREYTVDFGEDTVAAFLECIELWLNDRGNTVAAAALRLYMQDAISPDYRSSCLHDVEDDLADAEHFGARDGSHDSDAVGALAFPLAASTVSMYATDHFAAPADTGEARHTRGAPASRLNAAVAPRSGTRDETRPRVPGAVVASRAALRAPRFADNGPAAHSYRSSRSR